ncbi:hypothetical protein V501_01024 [Pseudogymnoascus sp. VKM F-4519 (FW-2642)]|nr:hypothetical protein V501_01024 [Pseudogymnoascus sp. VKM F-4519 (FW-2642)]
MSLDASSHLSRSANALAAARDCNADLELQGDEVTRKRRRPIIQLYIDALLTESRYVQRLLDTIKSHEEKELQQKQEEPQQGPRATSLATETSLVNGLHSLSRHITPDEEANGNTTEDEHRNALLTPATDLPSGFAFESRVRSIMREHATHRWNAGTSFGGSTLLTEEGDSNSNAQWRGALDLVNEVSALAFLSKPESHRLFNVFISLMGINQHFLDPRTFADSIDLLYQSELTQASQKKSIWFTQYLLVMALGMLIGSPSKGSDNPPGNAHFAEAMSRLPPVHQLGSYGGVSVEILCLIGLAVRLAIALGHALPHDEQQGVTSEISHHTRVWWTAYMLDRRLSAALGLPMAVDERQIHADLPKASAGFQPPLSLTINIQIARATGEIMTSFYGKSRITQTDLVQRIQSMLQRLYETGRSIPPNLTINFENPRFAVSRTGASLYLMLFQGIILCLRPLILQCVKDKVQSSKENHSSAVKSPLLTRLCFSCRDAASRSIRILSKLKDNKSIALFGYFDLDATFSAAFILAMMGFIEGNGVQAPPEELSRAAEVLQYLSKAGNKAAQRRLDELRQFCSHVWPLHQPGEWERFEDDGSEGPSMPANLFSAANAESPGYMPQLNASLGGGVSMGDPINADIWNGLNTVPGGRSTLFDFNEFGEFSVSHGSDSGDIYLSYNDPNLPLTGIDDVDWTEIGKMFHLSNM